jgi:hypothetical protein
MSPIQRPKGPPSRRAFSFVSEKPSGEDSPLWGRARPTKEVLRASSHLSYPQKTWPLKNQQNRADQISDERQNHSSINWVGYLK